MPPNPNPHCLWRPLSSMPSGSPWWGTRPAPRAADTAYPSPARSFTDRRPLSARSPAPFPTRGGGAALLLRDPRRRGLVPLRPVAAASPLPRPAAALLPPLGDRGATASSLPQSAAHDAPEPAMRGNPLHQSVSCGHPLQPGGRWPSPTPSPHRRRRPRPHVWIWTVLPAAATSSTSFDALAASPAAVRLARRWLSPPGGLVRVRAPSPSDGCDDAACQAAARPHPALLGEVQPAAVLDAARQRAVGSRPQATWWRGVRVGSADSVVSTAPPSPLVTTPMSATACPLSATTWGSPVSASRCCPLGSPASSTCVSEDVIFLCIESTAPTAAHAAGAHCREASPARVTSRLLQRGEYYQK